MKFAITVLAGLVLVACGPTPAASTTPSAQPAVRLAVVEGVDQTGHQANAVAIVGLDGHTIAQAQFEPRLRPYIGNAGVPLQPVAQVVGSAMYYIDGYGTVRSLRVGAQPQIIGSFSTQPAQYETWFAVSPDGTGAISGVLQFPAIGTPPCTDTSLQCMPPLVGPWQFRLMTATAGGQPKVLQQVQSPNHPDSSTGGWHPTFPVAWVAGGPVAMAPASIGTQNAWWGGPLFQLDGAGKQSLQVGGADCTSAIVTGSGFIPCTSGSYGVTVRDLSGNVLWTTHIDGFNALSLHVSPDGQGVTDGTKVETRTAGLIAMPAGFNVEGWLDNNTVVGWQQSSDGLQPGDLSWIKVGDPATVHDLGFKGDFVGTLSS